MISRRLRPEDWQEHGDFEPLTLEKIVGINNLLSIAWLSKGLELAASVARILMLDGVGTGFLLSPNLLLTNHHVLPDKQSCKPDTSVYFNYQTDWNGRIESSSRYELDPSQFTTDEELDYTIVAVKGDPGTIFGYVDISNCADPAVNDYVSIIQHPMGGPKQISLTDNKVSRVFGNRVQYTTDTEAGSSGSPVFNSNWQIVGLHHAGGNLAGPNGTRYFTNEGILITSVIGHAARFLGRSDVSDALYDTAFGELRSLLVKLVKQEGPLRDPIAFARQAFQQQPRFRGAVQDRLALGPPVGDSNEMALAVIGVAVGASIRQWAREGGHEAIAAAAESDPYPSKDLDRFVGGFRGSSDLPSDVYARTLQHLKGKPSLVAPIVERLAGASGLVESAAAFLIGVSVAAKAYDATS